MMAATATAGDFERLLTRDGAQGGAVVLLGQKALGFYERRPQSRQPVFVGGVDIFPGQTSLPGVSLAVDPRIYLKTLREMLPRLQKVVVYYDARDGPWIDHIKKIAPDEKLGVLPVPVSGAPEIARKLGDTFSSIDPETTALWFGRDTLAHNTEVLYPYVLEQAWDRRIAVVSDTIAHVRRGFLFAFYPNYLEVGKELGALVRQSGWQPVSGLRWTQAGQLTLNTRTARRLGIELAPSVIQRAKPAFPEL
ncbi:MAG: hypothetical protein JNM60_09675 [Candidatus Competibacteraceae bacterium]|nr:hypothetical protein [Candidatus Competibacteraceae bacterium]